MRQRRDKGQSIVEVALVLPVVVMLMLGLLDFGRAYYAIVALRDAADEGASYAAMNPTDVDGICRRAVEASRQLVQIREDGVAITYSPALTVVCPERPGDGNLVRPTLFVGGPVTVTTSLALELYTPFASSFIPGDLLTLRGRATHAIITAQ